MPRLRAGDTVGDYVVERFLAEGGNGEVYVARDAAGATTVALKILSQFSPAAAVRFDREVRVLRALDHPGIVRLFGHGQHDELPYLAMELLSGETLEARLEKGALDVETAVRVVGMIGEALAHAHARGVVHRDLKPANVFVTGEPRILGVKVLDFGIARHTDDRKVTRTGALIGTPAYMAPEQARGDPTIDARADVFALGCVLYEALTGRQAFAGEQFVAVLAKILLDEPTPLREALPGVSPALDELVTRMLAKDPGSRPASASAVVDALAKLEPSSTATPTPARVVRPSAAITAGEQRIVSAILVRRDGDPAVDATIAATRAGDDDVDLRAIAERHGASMAILVDGTAVIAISGHGNAVDQSVRAAGCALEIVASDPGARVVLATGRAETTGPWPVGPVIERAASLLVAHRRTGTVSVDDLTARLLDTRFHVQDGTLYAHAEPADGVRTLLGRPVRCVGREKEIALLEATLDESIDEPVSRAVLIVAPPGLGKSRVQTEFVTRARSRARMTVLSARTDPVSAGSALSIARQLVSAGVGSAHGTDLVHAIATRLTELRVSDAERVSEFLEALGGAAPRGEPSPQMVAARNDPRVMGEWIRRSFLDWLAAEISAQPVLLVIEDLHWGDATSVAWLGEALRVHARSPLMVIATARPEVSTAFPDLWSHANAQWLRLGGLPRRAAEKLVRGVLGDSIDDAGLARLVERADGNAFYLEELVRSVAERKSAELPETVLAMAQARHEGLAPEARRLLRAASVFGERFWTQSVEALVGGEPSHAALERLVEIEVLVRSPASRFPNQTEYAFRHGLLREAAYASLPREDATRAHALAGEWLEAAGERDALVLAEHFERGGVTDRAVQALLRACEATFWGSDFVAACAIARRGIAVGASGRTRGLLQSIRAGAAVWNAEWNEAIEAGQDASRVLDSSESWWWYANAMLMFASATVGNRTVAIETVTRMLGASDPAQLTGQYALGMATVNLALYEIARFDAIVAIRSRVEAFEARSAPLDLVARGWLLVIRGTALLSDRPFAALAAFREAATSFRSAGDSAGLAGANSYLCIVLNNLGRCVEAQQVARDNIDWAAGSRSYLIETRSRVLLERSLHRCGEPPADPAFLAAGYDSPDQTVRSSARAMKAYRAFDAGQLDEAERIARPLMEVPIASAVARLILARVALARGRPADVLAIADSAVPFASHFAPDRADLDAVRIEALLALGETSRARELVRAARDRVESVADGIDDPGYRDSFRTGVAAHRAILEMAERVLGPRDEA